MKMDRLVVRRGKLIGVLRGLAVVGLMVVVGACGNSVKFPISTVTPAADIVAVRSHDGNGNSMIRITARNLAAVDRIESPNKAYVVWIVTERDGSRNIGKLMNRNSRTARLETLIPANATEVYITAEEDGEAIMPSGIEISRIRFEK
jgi:hypothetical protein